MLFGQQTGTDEADQGFPGREDPEDIGAPPNLLVEPFLRMLDQTWRQIRLGNLLSTTRRTSPAPPPPWRT